MKSVQICVTPIYGVEKGAGGTYEKGNNTGYCGGDGA